MFTKTKMDSLLAPTSVAIVGVSPNNNRSTLAYENLMDVGFEGEVYFVNPKYNEINGKECYPSIDDIPANIDTIFVGIPSEYVLDTLKQAKQKGAKSAVIIYS